MKKILSLGLVAAMAMSAMPMAYATTAHTNGTQVEYVADADANREYTITVPALLNPGQSGAVTLKGKWASNETVKVTADATVELTNSINENDKKVLNIGFNGIEKAGDNTVERTYTENVSVAAMPSDALFGTWSGKFNYNVEFDDAYERTTVTAVGDHPGETKAIEIVYTDGMTWREWVNSSHAVEFARIITSDTAYKNTVCLGFDGYLLDENNHFISPDAVIDPSAHYETYSGLNWNEEDGGGKCGSPTFGAVEPTWP